MINQVIQLDQQWFSAINEGLANPVFDVLMPILRNRLTWVPLYVLASYVAIKKFGRTGGYMLLFGILCFALADYTTASLLKPWVARLRPCNTPGLSVRSLIACGTGYSFPSSHAANHFALALFFVVLFGRNSIWSSLLPLFWAFCIAFAQVYVGVHFPIDVIAGGAIGALIGLGFGYLFHHFFAKELWKSGK
ncbi:MAG: phosphatase PAP2 family protein [Sphingobacteriaceae bacterium]